MHTIRTLTSDEHPAWSELVAQSPQAGLFQTLAWNRMLCETSGRAETCLPIVCEHRGSFLGGVLLRCLEQKGRRRADLPPFGYNGPFLAAGLDYSKRWHTMPSYLVLEGLLTHVRGLVDCAVIHNQPELWDMRAFKYQRWKLGTSYTHVFRGKASNPGTDAGPELKGRMASALDGVSMDVEPSEGLIRGFCHQAQHGLPSRRLLEQRVRRLLEAGVGRLAAARARDGRVLAISLLLLSRENRTVYVLETVHPVEGTPAMPPPSLLWETSRLLLDGVEQLDLGDSWNAGRVQRHDHQGCELLPRFSATL